MPQSESAPPPSLCRVGRRDGALSSRCAELRISYPTSRFQRSDGARPAPRIREPGVDPACPRADPSESPSRIQRPQRRNLARIQHESSSANRATDGPRMASDRSSTTGRKSQDQAKTGGMIRKRGGGMRPLRREPSPQHQPHRDGADILALSVAIVLCFRYTGAFERAGKRQVGRGSAGGSSLSVGEAPHATGRLIRSTICVTMYHIHMKGGRYVQLDDDGEARRQ